MKSTTVIYWTSTTIYFLFEALMPAFTSHTEVAVEAIRHLGYPDYFRVMLTVFKVLGGIVLIVPQFPSRLKEWAYAGCTFNLIAATVSNIAVNGWVSLSFFPLSVMAILAVSYIYYHKKIN